MQTMRKQIGILVVLGLLALVAGSVSAQNLNIQLDEWGNGVFNGSSLPFVPSAVDPLSGQATLMYQLPFAVTQGDLVLTDAIPAGTISDIVRFEDQLNSAGIPNGVVYFFSDIDGPPLSLADTGIPPVNTALPPVFIPELSSGGNTGAIYTPGAATDPGNALLGGVVQPVTYTIVSDGTVPEPSTFVLLGMSAIGLLGYGWRRRRQTGV